MPDNKEKSTKKTVNEKEKVFPSNTIWASSIGELLDNEFNRLTDQNKLSIDAASQEINKLSDYCKYWNSATKKPFLISDKAIFNAYERCYEKQKLKAFECIRNNTQYDGITSLPIVIRKIQDLLLPILVHPRTSEIMAMGLAHWMWAIKRRIYDLEVENHLAIGFINEGLGDNGQGSGKTTFVKNICRPFFEGFQGQFLFSDIQLSDVTDNRAWEDVLSKLIIFLDDVSPESKHDTAILKSILSCNGKKSARPLYGKRLKDFKVSLSAIFTANTDNFGDIIKDISGNRRYLPIHVKNMKGIISKDLDFLVFWKMIDHNWPCFVSQRMFHDTQKLHMTKSCLELLLDQYGARPWNEDTGGDCTQIFPTDLKLVLNKHFPKEKTFSTTQSVSKEMSRLEYMFKRDGGKNRDRLVYLIRFHDNCFDRWQQNFGEKSSDKPDHRSPSKTSTGYLPVD